MSSSSDHGRSDLLIVDGAMSGRTLIPSGTPLSRLNYFNGKFLSADDFALEQRYIVELVRLSNRGLGSGVVYGFDTELAGGDTLLLGPGLAMEASGHVVYLPQAVSLSISELIEATRQRLRTRRDESGKEVGAGFGDCVEVVPPPAGEVLPASELYVIAVCRAEALCGEADVYGKLCEDACVTSTDRRFRKEGVVVRALPLFLRTPLPTSGKVAVTSDKYLRSRVAHAYYADERLKHPDDISSAGLHSEVWCHGAGYDAGCCEVPLAVIDRAGNVTTWLDPWIVRRERMDAPAKRYWQWKMRMRPWDVFLAQVLQFQCHLAHLLDHRGRRRLPDPCSGEREALAEVERFLKSLDERMRSTDPSLSAAADTAALSGLSFTRLAGLKTRVEDVLRRAAAAGGLAKERVLIDGGMVEVPPGGYLPVVPTSELTVNAQVRALLGDGLDYRFCVVRPDFVAHALEEVQHMDRISLLEGLDDPTRKPAVDILVPDGRIVRDATAPDAKLYRARLAGSAEQTGGLVYRGTAREEALAEGGAALYVGAAGLSQAFIPRLALALHGEEETPATFKTLDPNLEGSRYVRRDPLDSARFETLLRDIASSARTYAVSDASERAAPAPSAPTGSRTRRVRARAPATLNETLNTYVEKETVDGFWLEARCDKRVRELPLYGATPFSVRGIVGQFKTGPFALELALTGVFTAHDVRRQADGSTVVEGSASGKLVADLVYEQPARQQDLQMLLHRRVTLKARFTFAAGDLTSGATLELLERDEANEERATLQVKRQATTSPLSAEYTVSFGPASGAAAEVRPFLTLMLEGDQDVLRPTHPYHRLATQGLDIVYAAYDVVEPGFRREAEAKLYPRLPLPSQELTIQAVHDWVLFHRRRDKQCAGRFEPVMPLPRRSYRVFNVTVDSEDEAASLGQQLRNPARLEKAMPGLLRQPELIITYEGGTATPAYDAGAAARDWAAMGPGERIVYALYGAVDDTDAALQDARANEFERVIQAHSDQAPGIVEVPIAPLPPGARPPDADGIMLFITVRAIDCQTVVRVPRSNDQESWPQFVEKLPTLTLAEMPSVLRGLRADVLGTAEFRGGTGDLRPGALEQVRTKLGTQRVVDAVVWTRQKDPERALRLPQAKAVIEGLGDSASGATHLREATSQQPEPLGDCPSVLFTLVERH